MYESTVEELLQVCSECGKQNTKEKVLADIRKCNFCDVPYIILEQEKK